MERMWAYQTIKKLLKEAELKSDGNATEKKKEALRLSLKVRVLEYCPLALGLALIMSHLFKPNPTHGFGHGSLGWVPEFRYQRRA